MLANFTLKSVPPQLAETFLIFVLPIIILVLYGCAVKALLFGKASKIEFAAWYFCTIFALAFSVFVAGSNHVNRYLFPAIALIFCGWKGFSWLKPVRKQSEIKTTFSQNEADNLWLNPPTENCVQKRRFWKTTLRIIITLILGAISFALIFLSILCGVFYNLQGFC